MIFEHIVQYALVVDVCNLARLCKKADFESGVSCVGCLYIPQDGCVIFDDSIISGISFRKASLLLLSVNAVICELGVGRLAQRGLRTYVGFPHAWD